MSSAESTNSENERFQVDLSGIIDLLSKHLYSGPQVYVRELLQNGADAITARREIDPECAAKIKVSVDETQDLPVITVHDSGIGLTSAEARSLLATIGKSSKRDTELGVGRAEFLGQFGIGLLSGFLVADKIEVWSKSAKGGSAIYWVGESGGTFSVTELTEEQTPEPIRAGCGTLTRLVARYDSSHWLSHKTVKRLLLEYGSLLPFEVLLKSPLEFAENVWQRITRPELPWQASYSDSAARRRALDEYCEKVFGVTPLDVIDLRVPALGITGVAYVLPQTVAPGSGQHYVYLKRMLLGGRIENILPDWAFFVRAIIDTDSLHPTASREQLHEDQALLIARDAMGEQLKNWIKQTLTSGFRTASAFLRNHNLALRAAAITDTSLLDILAETMPYETTLGALTLAEAKTDGLLLYTPTVEGFRRIASVARVAGICVLNAGYAYDTEIMEKLGAQMGWSVRELELDDITRVLTHPSVEREMMTAEAISKARQLLAEVECDVLLRSFEPQSMPAMMLIDGAGSDGLEDFDAAAEDDIWADLVDTFAAKKSGFARTLVLNDNSTTTAKLLEISATSLFEAALNAIYISALSQSGEHLSESESNTLAAALEALMQQAIDGRGGSANSEGA